MKFIRDSTPGNTVTAWAAGQIRIRDQIIRNNVILTVDRIIHPWSGRSAGTLVMEDMAPLLALKPSMIVLGTGATMEFPASALSAAILSQGIGLEVMDTPAACRTFNILVQEGRDVAAALIVTDLRSPALPEQTPV